MNKTLPPLVHRRGQLPCGQLPQRSGPAVGKQGRAQPVQRREGGGQGVLLHLPLPVQPFRPGGGLAAELAGGRGKDQAFLGPGQRHVEDTHLLGQALFALAAGHGQMGQGVEFQMLIPQHPAAGQTQVALIDHVRLFVPGVETRGQAGHEDHGEFQPLAFMDGHDLHRVRAFPGRQGRFDVAVQTAVVIHAAEEAEQTGGALLLILMGPGVQQVQIGLPAFAALHGSYQPHQIRIVIHLQQQLIHAAFRSQPSPGVKLSEESAYPSGAGQVAVGGQMQGLPQLDLFIQKTYLHQLVAAEPEYGRAQDGGQGDVLPRIIDQPQQIQGQLYLGAFGKGGAAAGHGRDAGFRQCRGDDLFPVPAGAQQDGDL